MADVISRLKLDSGEFDSKIKRAGQELMAYSEHCKKMGLEMGYANKDAKEFAKALGSMQTTSSSARGKINELTEAFVNLKVMYKNMTDEEKNNTFGKNLAASLDQLKTRIDQAKSELNDVNAELGNTKKAEVDTKGALEGLTSALGINIKNLAGWGTAIAAGKVALDVAKDAFFASESSVDEWGRTMAASQSLYEGFLTAINNGDISGYLSRMDEIVQAARAAYNELDTLGTMKTIQAPKMSAQQTENERFRMMIQTGRYIAPVDGRKASMKDGQLLTPEQIKTLERQLQNGMKSVVKLVGNEVKQTGKAINAYYNSIAKQNGMSLQEFKKGTSSWEEFSKKMQGYDDYKKWDKEARTEFAKQGGRGNVDFDKSNPFAEFRKWGTFRVDKMGDNSYNDLVRLIQQRDQQAAQAYGMQSQTYRTMNRAEGVTVRQIMGGGGGRSGGSGSSVTYMAGSLAAQQAEVQRLTKLWQDSGEAVRDTYLQPLVEAEKKLQQMKDVMGMQKDLAMGKFSGEGAEDFRQSMRNAKGLTESIDKKNHMLLDDKALAKAFAEAQKQPKKKEEKEEKKYLSEGLSQLSGGLGGLQSGFSQLGIDLGDGFGSVVQGLQGITTILMAIQTIVGAIEVISAADSIIPFSGGGTVPKFANSGVVPKLIGKAAGGMLIPGTSYSGDNLRIPVDGGRGVIGVNSGELILNMSSQNNLASALKNAQGLLQSINVDRSLSRTQQSGIATAVMGGGMQNLHLETYLDGRAIRIVLNNESQGRLKGKYVTSQNLRG